MEIGISGSAYSHSKNLDGSTAMFQQGIRAEVFRSWIYSFM